MVLCPNCHDMATKGVLREAEQRKLKAQPRNRKKGFANGMLFTQGRYPAVSFGTNVLINDGPLIMLGDEVVLGAKVSAEGSVLLDMAFRDRAGTLLTRIVENEWTVGDPGLWDLEFGYKYLRLRERKHKVLFSLNARTVPIALRATFWYQGSSLSISAGKMVITMNKTPFSFTGMMLAGAIVQYVPEGFKIDMDPRVTQPFTFFTYSGPESLQSAMEWIDAGKQKGTQQRASQSGAENRNE